MLITNRTPSLQDPVGSVFHRASVAIRCALDAAIAQQVSPELTGLRGMALGFIVECSKMGKPVYQRDLENRFHINRSSVTVMLQGLEQSGFIIRTAVEQDARLKSLSPTQKGLDCNQAVRDCVHDFEFQIRSGVAQQDLEATYRVIRRILQNLDEQQSAAKE